MTSHHLIHATFMLERHLPCQLGRAFAAFADKAIKQKWFGSAPTHDLVRHDMDFRVGGTESLIYRMNHLTPFPGVKIANTTTYLDIALERHVVVSETMVLGDHRISAALISFEFLENATGTTLLCTHQGVFFEGADGPQMREQGWVSLFDRLATAVS